MHRRQFIGLVGAAATWPLATSAQRSDRTRRISVFTGYVENDPEAERRVEAFRKRLSELGWSVGHNIEIDYRWAAADLRRVETYAADLATRKPEVVLAAGEQIVFALRRTMPGTPIVFVQIDDPVGAGIIASLARPGGNLTGFTPMEFSLGGKMPELLKETAPRVTRAATLLNPGSAPMPACSVRSRPPRHHSGCI